MTGVERQLSKNNTKTVLRAPRRMAALIFLVVLATIPLSTPCHAQGSGPSKTYVIYFPHADSKLTSEANQVAMAAAKYTESLSSSRVIVVGYCDTSEKASRNLSSERAKNTVAALRAAGVSDHISVQTSRSGTEDPAVPTPPGTGEPLNRRAEIEIWFGRSGALNAQLIAASQTPDTARVAQLLAQGADIEAKDSRGNTPLMHAASAGTTAVVELLLSKGADEWAANDAGEQPADCALDGQHPDIVRLITRWAANQSLAPLDKQLFDEASKGDNAAVARLLTEGAHINARDLYGDTPLIKAVVAGNEAVVKLLLDNGADIEARDISSKTPIMAAYDPEVARLLILKGANLEARSSEGRTALMFLAESGYTNTVRLLLDAGANPTLEDHQGKTAIEYAKEEKHDDIVQLLSQPPQAASPSAGRQLETASSDSTSATPISAPEQSATSSDAAQSESGPDWSKSDPKEWPERTRILLKDFQCPDGASAEACGTFQKLAAAGDQELAAQFSIMFLDRKYFFPLILVAFEGKRDQFWIVTVLADRAKGGLEFWRVTYAHYIGGTIIASAYGENVPINGDSATFTSQKHNDVSLILGSAEDTTVNAVETDHLPDGRSLTVKLVIEKSKGLHLDPKPVPGTITYHSGTFHETQNVKVARFFNKIGE